MRTAALLGRRGRLGGVGWPGGRGPAPVMVSVGPDGECVEVVDEDAPAGVGLLAVMALQAGPAQSVAAFEVADATLDAGAVARLALAGASGAGFVAAGDEHARVLGDRVAGRAGLEAAVADQLARPDP